MSAKGLIGPCVIGLAALLFELVGAPMLWVSVALTVGVVIGYLDPWDSNGRRRT